MQLVQKKGGNQSLSSIYCKKYTVKKMEFYNPGSGINIHFRIVNILSFPFNNFTKRELNFPKRFSK